MPIGNSLSKNYNFLYLKVDGNEEPLHIPGDRLRARKKELNQTQSMQYTKPLLEMSKLLAKELKVKPLTPLADS